MPYLTDTLSIAEELISVGEDEKIAKTIARLLSQWSDSAKLEHEKALEQKSLATKKDLDVTKLELTKEIELVRKDVENVRKEIETVKLELTGKIETTKLELQKEIKGVEVRLIKWLIGAVISGVASLGSFMYILFNLFARS